MSVEELNRVHRRYIRISNHFKAGWTFHQFIQGLRKAFPDVGPPNYPADFQQVYGDLKQVTQNLSETAADTAARQLDAVERGLVPLVQSLLAADDVISPGLLRQFFQRVKNYDDNILTQLIKFFLYSQEGLLWNFHRLDKADYLVTKMCTQYLDGQDVWTTRDQTFLRETGQGLWAALDVHPTAETELATITQRLHELRGQINATESIENLHGTAVVQAYRDFKHGLGNRFFEPRILPEILATNLALKNHIQRLYKRDEQRIVAEYQEVFELEREVPIDIQLGEELEEFRAVVDRFEKQLEGDDLKLKEVAHLREKVRSLVPKLRPQAVDDDSTVDVGPFVAPPEVREVTGVAPVVPQMAEYIYLEEFHRSIVEALDDTNPTKDPQKVALEPEVFTLAVSPREIVAYRRLFGGATCDAELEAFLLYAAALRVRVEREVEEIKGILDDTAVNQDAPIFGLARRTCEIGDLFMRRFEHYLERCIISGDGKDALRLQRLKMRLTRAYSGLWLMVHR
ncbi:MAG: hypothetical protein AAFX50_10715 [Acidobacteriota bacterium]